jgi:Rrf2 family nitric oxide-sensitive transcriptional repressor
MRLSLQTDFALRTLMFLAANEGHHSIAAISSGYGISRNHLMKVAQRLVAEGFVKSVLGRNGGLMLARPAAEINVGAVVRAIEYMGTFVECFDPTTNHCAATPVCGLRHVLAGGVEAFMAHLGGFTVAQLIGDPENFRTAFQSNPTGLA